jgi:hypothetical protein
MSGLIWSALGKGIANTGDMVGRYAIGQAEEEQRSAREIAREERLLARKDAQEEAQRQRVIREQQQIEARADDMPIKRDVQALGNLGARVQGDSPVMDEAEREALIRENPQYREVYRRAGVIEDKMDPRLQRAEDESSAALGIGASSSVIDFYSKKRADVLNAIKEENRDRIAGEKEDRLNEQFQALLPIRQQTANAATTRANKPPASGSGGSRGDATGIRTLQDFTNRERTLRNQMAKAFGTEREELRVELRDLLAQRKVFENQNRGGNTPRTSDNSGTRPPLSSFNRP